MAPTVQLHPPSIIPAIFQRRPKSWESIKAVGIAFLLVRLHLASINRLGGKVAQCLPVFEIGFGLVGFRIRGQGQ